MSITFQGGELHWSDYLIIVIYFVAVLAVGIWSSNRSARDNLSGYFLASRNMHWFLVGSSLFASNIGSEHFIGLAGSGAASGIAIAVFETNAIFILMFLGWVFVPVYIAAGVYTMPEYLRKRFGGQRIRIFLATLSLMLYIFTKISADLFSGALFIKFSLGLKGEGGLYLAIIILVSLAALFTIAGGLSAVIWTDFIQAILMVIGALILMGLTFEKVGGYEALFDGFNKSVPADAYSAFEVDSVTGHNVSCSAVNPNFAHMVRSPDDPNMPWTGILSGIVIGSIWYWCADQVIVQRTLASKNLSHAKGGCVFAATMKLLPLFTLVLPGMAARVLFTDEVACSNPEKCKEICESESGCTNIAFIKLVLKVMPDGLRGLMVAIMLAALMSSLTSIFNSASTIFTMDIWTRIRKRASEMELIIVGRCFVVVLVAISILWIPSISGFHNSQLFHYVQAISNFLSPPVAAVYVLAILWKRFNEPGAFWALISGFGIGLIRFGLEFGYNVPACGSGKEDPRPEWVKVVVGQVHYLHFGGISFAFTIIVAVIVTLFTDPIPISKLYRLTFWSRHSTRPREELDADDELETHRTRRLQNMEDHGAFVRLFFKICAVSSSDVESNPAKELTKEEEARHASEFLDEDPFWSRFCNTQAILVMSTAVFVWAFYA